VNGNETKYLNDKFIELNTKFKERWDSHDKASIERWGRLDKGSELLAKKFEVLDDRFSKTFAWLEKLPCPVNSEKIESLEEQIITLKNNDLHSINKKINALLFTVLASVFTLILAFCFKFIMIATVAIPIVKP